MSAMSVVGELFYLFAFLGIEVCRPLRREMSQGLYVNLFLRLLVEYTNFFSTHAL